MGYEDSLDRALEETPDIEGESERFDVPDAEVRQEGNASVYENFQATVDRLDREPTSVMKFLQTELGTSAHIDESGRLRLTGSFDEDRIDGAIEAYTEAYVICPECGLPDTHLEREQGAQLLRCDACGARTSVE